MSLISWISIWHGSLLEGKRNRTSHPFFSRGTSSTDRPFSGFCFSNVPHDWKVEVFRTLMSCLGISCCFTKQPQCLPLPQPLFFGSAVILPTQGPTNRCESRGVHKRRLDKTEHEARECFWRHLPNEWSRSGIDGRHLVYLVEFCVVKIWSQSYVERLANSEANK